MEFQIYKSMLLNMFCSEYVSHCFTRNKQWTSSHIFNSLSVRLKLGLLQFYLLLYMDMKLGLR